MSEPRVASACLRGRVETAPPWGGSGAPGPQSPAGRSAGKAAVWRERMPPRGWAVEVPRLGPGRMGFACLVRAPGWQLVFAAKSTLSAPHSQPHSSSSLLGPSPVPPLPSLAAHPPQEEELAEDNTQATGSSGGVAGGSGLRLHPRAHSLAGVWLRLRGPPSTGLPGRAGATPLGPGGPFLLVQLVPGGGTGHLPQEVGDSHGTNAQHGQRSQHLQRAKASLRGPQWHGRALLLGRPPPAETEAETETGQACS